MALLALIDIDWQLRTVGNMGFRVEPSWCDRGIGTLLLHTVADWCFAQGIHSLRLDVAASNARAIHCYEKVGFAITGEFWRDAEDLRDVDTSQPAYAFVRPHLRRTGTTPQIRFWWMQRERKIVEIRPL
jgi:RimJ/RimL family protein N-acetyltransferase